MWASPRLAIVLAGIAALSGCAYRFTNSHIGQLIGMRTIAIEAIYDTSAEVIPHEVLWEALQRAFASDGHIRVVSRREADLLLRAHVTSAALNPSNFAEQGPEKDPVVFEGGPPPKPSEYKRLSTARDYATRENVSVGLIVDVWKLDSGKKVLEKGYSGARSFDSLRANAPDPYNFIRHDEALTQKVDEIANEIAGSVVSDLLLSREYPQSTAH